MAVLHRALFTWFVLLVFLILIVLRLDSQTNWNWFIVFIPLWVYDSILLIYLFFNMMSLWKNRHDRLSNSVLRKMWYLFAIILKLASQIMLCLKLQNIFQLSTYYVLTPLWILLPLLIIDVFFTLVRENNNRYL